MPVVHLPDGRIVHFPDEMPLEQITQAIDSLSGHQPAKSNTGMSTEQLQAANLKDRPDLPSATGFLKNAASSGAQFATDTIKGLPSLLGMIAGGVRANFDPQYRIQQAREVGEALPGMAKAAGQSIKQRYGSVDQALGTAYHDPAGTAADISIAAGGAGLAADAANAPKIARVLNLVSEATNPMVAMRPLAKAVEYGTAGAVRPMLKPSLRLKRQQDSALEIERTALKSGAFTEGLASGKQNTAVQRATDMADSAQGSVPRAKILQMPETLKEAEGGLSVPSDLDALANVEMDASQSLPANVTARELLDKRRNLDRRLNKAFRAEEMGGAPTGIREAGQKEILGNVRSELRGLAPDIREADDQARRMGLVRNAIKEAGLRAGDIPMGGALLGAGLLGAGVPGATGLGAAFAAGRTFPQIPLALGSIPVAATAAAANPLAQKAGLVAALINRLQGGGGE